MTPWRVQQSGFKCAPNGATIHNSRCTGISPAGWVCSAWRDWKSSAGDNRRFCDLSLCTDSFRCNVRGDTGVEISTIVRKSEGCFKFHVFFEWMKYRCRMNFVCQFYHSRSVMYEICKNFSVHNSKVRSNRWIIISAFCLKCFQKITWNLLFI